jgi:hypothetical protein
MTTKANLTIEQGETFETVVRWETPPLKYKPISAMTQTAPVSITATGHAIPNGWRVAVVDAKGMTELNAASAPPADEELRAATVIDANTVEFNEVSAALFKAYKSGGYLAYYTPQDLTGYTARMTIRDRVGGTELVALTSADSEIIIDAAAFTITIAISAAATAAFTWTKGVYDLELVSSTGRVARILSGTVTLSKEVTS